jgi:hypothetical protein
MPARLTLLPDIEINRKIPEAYCSTARPVPDTRRLGHADLDTMLVWAVDSRTPPTQR